MLTFTFVCWCQVCMSLKASMLLTSAVLPSTGNCKLHNYFFFKSKLSVEICQIFDVIYWQYVFVMSHPQYIFLYIYLNELVKLINKADNLSFTKHKAHMYKTFSLYPGVPCSTTYLHVVCSLILDKDCTVDLTDNILDYTKNKFLKKN